MARDLLALSQRVGAALIAAGRHGLRGRVVHCAG